MITYDGDVVCGLPRSSGMMPRHMGGYFGIEWCWVKSLDSAKVGETSESPVRVIEVVVANVGVASASLASAVKYEKKNFLLHSMFDDFLA